MAFISSRCDLMSCPRILSALNECQRKHPNDADVRNHILLCAAEWQNTPVYLLEATCRYGTKCALVAYQTTTKQC